MGVASTTDQDTRSSFSNFGMIVWVAAPGEAIVTTYPFNTYAAGWGTSFSAPFVSGGAALLHNLNAPLTSPVALRRWRMQPRLRTPAWAKGGWIFVRLSRQCLRRVVHRISALLRHHPARRLRRDSRQTSPPPLHRCVVPLRL